MHLIKIGETEIKTSTDLLDSISNLQTELLPVFVIIVMNKRNQVFLCKEDAKSIRTLYRDIS